MRAARARWQLVSCALDTQGRAFEPFAPEFVGALLPIAGCATKVLAAYGDACVAGIVAAGSTCGGYPRVISTLAAT